MYNGTTTDTSGMRAKRAARWALSSRRSGMSARKRHTSPFVIRLMRNDASRHSASAPRSRRQAAARRARLAK